MTCPDCGSAPCACTYEVDVGEVACCLIAAGILGALIYCGLWLSEPHGPPPAHDSAEDAIYVAPVTP